MKAIVTHIIRLESGPRKEISLRKKTRPGGAGPDAVPVRTAGRTVPEGMPG